MKRRGQKHSGLPCAAKSVVGGGGGGEPHPVQLGLNKSLLKW